MSVVRRVLSGPACKCASEVRRIAIPRNRGWRGRIAFPRRLEVFEFVGIHGAKTSTISFTHTPSRQSATLWKRATSIPSVMRVGLLMGMAA